MSNTIEIKKTNAISAWIGADQPGKKLLEDLLGKENVSGSATRTTFTRLRTRAPAPATLAERIKSQLM